MKECKMVLLGQAATGKTSILHRLQYDTFSETLGPTIGMLLSRLKINHAQMSVWDTCGQERFLALMPLYIRNAKICIVVFDLSDPQTFELALHHIKSIVEINGYDG